MRAPTGQQFVLSHKTATAVITEVGAAIRQLCFDGVDVMEPYAADVVPPFVSGGVLVPWPNRIRDGIWHLDGEEQQLDLTEPDKHNAIHGLVRDRPHTVVEQSENAITLGVTIYPTRGYPFEVWSAIRYELTDGGLVVTHDLRNVGDVPAPVAVGVHPFFRVGDVPTDEVMLTTSAASWIETDDRLLPTATLPVDGLPFDLRAGRPIGDLALDDAFADLSVDNGESIVTLRAPDGRTVELWQDENFPYLQIFTTRIFPRADGLATAIAIEPMTAPAEAFNSGDGLRWLQPDESWSLSWGVRYSERG